MQWISQMQWPALWTESSSFIIQNKHASSHRPATLLLDAWSVAKSRIILRSIQQANMFNTSINRSRCNLPLLWASLDRITIHNFMFQWAVPLPFGVTFGICSKVKFTDGLSASKNSERMLICIFRSECIPTLCSEAFKTVNISLLFDIVKFSIEMGQNRSIHK